MKKSLLFLALVIFSFAASSQSIYEIQGQASVSPFKDASITTQGIVSAVFSGSYFIQDGDSAWCGIYVYDNSNTPTLGDSVSFTALVTEYFELTELKDITNFQILSSGNLLPTAVKLTTGSAEEKWESVLVSVDSATCTNADLGFGEWEVNDGSGTMVVDNLSGTYLASVGVPYSITGPLNYSYSQFKVAPRSQEDIIMHLPLYFTEYPVQTDIQNTSLQLQFTTNDSSYSIVEYGLTTEYELGTITSSTKRINHQVALKQLNAAEVYYTKVSAHNEANDTTPMYTGSYATKSNSSGKINVSFVKPNILNTPNTIIDSLIHYIGKATHTLDIAIYDLTNHAQQSDSSNYLIIEAINEAYTSGVEVRVITDDAVANIALNSLNENIHILRGNTVGIMHNKFLVIDRNTVNSSWVVTGSTNWTYNNLMMDFNNLIAIQDQSLAKAYTVEFEEMWGSSTLSPDASVSRFGGDKKDNTPHIFDVNGTKMELYFSPSDNTESHIKTTIDGAQNSIDFAVMAFTASDLYSAITDAHKRGVATKGIIDYVEYSQTNFNNLVSSGVDVVDFVNANDSGWPDNTTCHHKYAVIDIDGSIPILVTGTHNWTASANSKHDENTLLVYNQQVAQKYVEELELMRNYIDGSLSNKEIISTTITLVPNPTSGTFVIQNKGALYQSVNIYNISGQKVKEVILQEETTTLDLDKEGLYLLVFKGKHTSLTKKLLVK